MDINSWFMENYNDIERVAKKVLREDFREGVSLYYLYLTKLGATPDDVKSHTYWYVNLLKKKTSPMNYRYKEVIQLPDGFDIPINDEKADLMIDLKDENLVDFIQNNTYTDKWIKIYRVVIEKKVDLDLFEYIMYDYVFNRGLSIREITKITNNSEAWVYKFRRSLINKLKKAISELNDN